MCSDPVILTQGRHHIKVPLESRGRNHWLTLSTMQSYILKATGRIRIRSAFGRLIVGQSTSQQSSVIGYTTPTHGSKFIIFQQIALTFSSLVMLGYSAFLNLQ